MGKRKIGFYQGDEPEETKKKSIDSPIKEFIQNIFTPSGDTENKEFKTSSELVYMLREFNDTSLRAINEVMNELGFHVTTIENKVHWIVYTKNQEYY